MTDKEIQIWTSTIENVLRENEEWDDKNKSERYHVVFEDVKMPPKVVVARAFDIIESDYPELPMKSIGGGVPTNQFLEDFGFKITEDLLYNSTDSKKLQKHIEKKVSNRGLFQDFVNFGHSFLSGLDIDVYKVRMALEAKGILSLIVGMRAAYSYSEKDGSARIGFLVSKDFKKKNEEKYHFVYEYNYKGNPEQDFIKIECATWSDIDPELLEEHKKQFRLQYDEIKNSKRTQWNVEAKTTNNALKYILFKNENINDFMQEKDLSSKKIPAYYCVGFHFYSEEQTSQLDRFIENGIWENGYDEKFTSKVNQVPVGSLIAAKTTYIANGTSILKVYAIGEVLENNNDGNLLKVAWNNSFEPFVIEGAGAYRNTISQVKSAENIKLIFHNGFKNFEKKSNDMKLENIHTPLNQILYGPPGTGKTYQTISKAIAIIDPRFYKANKNNREELVNKFTELTITNWSETDGQIAFCTFHQSFTYEDFVEGIKPKVIDDKDIIYENQKGIFKALCDKARTATNDTSDFDTVISKLQNDILNDGVVTLKTNRGNSFDVNYTGQTTFRIKPHESTQENPQYPAAIENIRMLYEGAPLTEVYNPSYVKGILEYMYSDYGLSKFEEIKDSDKPYIIIIDEINRGNVASIFGELITLIETDKRAGGKEELSVILPYSKKEFKVPNNVYIIGTMNTADRSVEALDSALRRRFSFTEVMPDYSVIKNVLKDKNSWNGIDIHLILKKINTRIIRLIDRDHQIGHSYFLKLQDVPSSKVTDSLKSIFSDNIIPLLQEYFFNDFNKIGLVLGSGFVKKVETVEDVFADFKDGDSSNYDDDIFELNDLETMTDEEFIEAVNKLVR